jgi:hypothetical protein
MERTIKSAFVDVDEDQDEGEQITAATTFGGQILREAIRRSGIFPATVVGDVIRGATVIVLDDTDPNPANRTHITVNITPDDLPEDVNVTYTITITGQLFVFVNPFERHDMQEVFVTDPVTGDPVMDTVPIDATPMTMTIAGDLDINLLTTFIPTGSMNQEEPVPYTFESVTTYRLEQLILIEDLDPLNPFDILKEDDPALADMLIDSPIVWTVIRYESFS